MHHIAVLVGIAKINIVVEVFIVVVIGLKLLLLLVGLLDTEDRVEDVFSDSVSVGVVLLRLVEVADIAVIIVINDVAVIVIIVVGLLSNDKFLVEFLRASHDIIILPSSIRLFWQSAVVLMARGAELNGSKCGVVEILCRKVGLFQLIQISEPWVSECVLCSDPVVWVVDE